MAVDLRMQLDLRQAIDKHLQSGWRMIMRDPIVLVRGTWAIEEYKGALRMREATHSCVSGPAISRVRAQRTLRTG